MIPTMKEQFEESEEIDGREREWVVVKHERKKYRCACNACVETASGPVKLRPGNRCSLNFAIGVVLSKYCDHLLPERQVRIMRREGLSVTSQVLWDPSLGTIHSASTAARSAARLGSCWKPGFKPPSGRMGFSSRPGKAFPTLELASDALNMKRWLTPSRRSTPAASPSTSIAT